MNPLNWLVEAIVRLVVRLSYHVEPLIRRVLR
jgi:hypothetical protein